MVTSLSRLDQIERLYSPADSNAIRKYLAERPELVELLAEARPHIEKQYGSGVEIELRIRRDLERDYEGELLAMVQSHEDADSALDKLDKLWDEWWSVASARREAWPLYIGVEYGPAPGQ